MLKEIKILRAVFLSGFVLLGSKLSMANDLVGLDELNSTLKLFNCPVLNEEEVRTLTDSVNEYGTSLTKNRYYPGYSTHVPNSLFYWDMTPEEVISLTNQLLRARPILFKEQTIFEFPVFDVDDYDTWKASILDTETIAEELRHFLEKNKIGSQEEINQIKPRNLSKKLKNMFLEHIHGKFQSLYELGHKAILEFIKEEVEHKQEVKQFKDFPTTTLMYFDRFQDSSRAKFWRSYTNIQKYVYSWLLTFPQELFKEFIDYDFYKISNDNSSDNEENKN